MLSKFTLRLALLALACSFFATTLSAQKMDLTLDAGGFWPRHTNFGTFTGDMKNTGIYGVKLGAFMGSNFEWEAGYSYINHFESKLSPTTLDVSEGIAPHSVYASAFDLNGVWNFGKKRFFGSRVSPYVTLGVGDLREDVRHATTTVIAGSTYVVNPITGAVTFNTVSPVLVRDGDNFFTFNYGFGIKALKLWGPVGLRADLRGRTIPNFYGHNLDAPELTGGLTFSLGK
jgi:hypothetical protein